MLQYALNVGISLAMLQRYSESERILQASVEASEGICVYLCMFVNVFMYACMCYTGY